MIVRFKRNDHKSIKDDLTVYELNLDRVPCVDEMVFIDDTSYQVAEIGTNIVDEFVTYVVVLEHYRL